MASSHLASPWSSEQKAAPTSSIQRHIHSNRDRLSHMRYPVPLAAITVNRVTQKYGFIVWFADEKPHYTMANVFETEQHAREYIDPHGELGKVQKRMSPQSSQSRRDTKRAAHQRGDVWKQ